MEERPRHPRGSRREVPTIKTEHFEVNLGVALGSLWVPLVAIYENDFASLWGHFGLTLDFFFV